MQCCDAVGSLHRQYYWYDERGKKIKCTAPQYVDFVMSSVQKLVTDEDVFPTKYGTLTFGQVLHMALCRC